MKKIQSKIKPMLVAVGAGMALSLASITSVQAASSNFSTDKLSSGYNIAGNHGGDKADGHKCGHGKCGHDKKNGHDKNGHDKNGGGKCGHGKCGG